MIIGIGGCSRSGKTTLANIIKSRYADDEAIVLNQDNFVFSEEEIPKINGHIDWECPQSMDFERLKAEIIKSKTKFKHVIVEGIMVFYDTELKNMFDKKIFIDIDKESFVRFKNSDLRWGKEPDWYVEHIWNSFEKYGRLQNDDNFLQIESAENPDMTLINNYLEA